jgi:outer membrane protein assembly factor BamB
MRASAVILCSVLLCFIGVFTLAAQTPPISVTPVNVITYHNNNQRLGLNGLETTLTVDNVNPATFGKVNFLQTDGQVYAEPLYVSNVAINSSIHNVVYVVTEHDSVYAFDADNGDTLWKSTVLLPNEVPSTNATCGLVSPEIGITSTPIIDLTTGQNGLIYVVSASQDENQAYHQRLHALDLTTGFESIGGPVELSGKYPGTGDGSQDGYVIFDPAQYLQRAALLELNHKIYIAFSSHCDQRPYTGWIMQYNAWSLQQLSVLDITPNGSEGSIWQSGGGLAADADGSIYMLVANGTFDSLLNISGFPINGDYGNTFLKVSGDTPMQVVDYFTMFNTLYESEQDLDLGSGGPIILDIPAANPIDPPVPVAIGAGKDTNIYVVNRYDMGKWNPFNDAGLYQELDGVVNYGIFSTPAVFNNTLYYGPENGQLTAFPIVNGYISSNPSSQSANIFGSRGTTPSISSDGFANGIVWANAYSRINYGVLHAYDARDLTQELYNSNMAGSRDQYGLATKFITPMIANGKVYVATPTGVAVFGLLGSPHGKAKATKAAPAH